MKKIKLFALAVMAMLSTNAFADSTNGTLKFQISGENATITGFAATAAAADMVNIEIASTIKDAADGKEYKVIEVAAEAFKDKTSIKSVKFSSANLVTIGASAFQGCSNLESVDFTGAAKLKNLNANAFKGAKFPTLDLSGTVVEQIYPLLGTTAGWPQVLYDATTAAAYNTAHGLTKAVAGASITTALAQAYNDDLDGAIVDGEQYTEDQANTYNALLVAAGALKNDGNAVQNTTGAADGTAISAANAIAYNKTLAGAYDFTVASGFLKTTTTFSAAGAAVYNATIKSPTDAAAEEDGAYGPTQEAVVDAFNAKLGNALPIDGTDAAPKKISGAKANAYNSKAAGIVAGAVAAEDVINAGVGTESRTYNDNLTGALPVDGATALTEAQATAYNKKIKYAFEGEEQYAAVPAVANTALTTVKLPATWVAFNRSAFDNGQFAGVFENCTGLTALDFGTSKDAHAQTLDIRAFNSCKALTEVTIPGTIAAIPASAFEDCSKLATVTFAHKAATASTPADAFTGIDSYAFSNIAAESITIPAQLNYKSPSAVAIYAFADCTSLTKFTYKPEIATGDAANVEKVVDDGAFLGCPNEITFYTSNDYKTAPNNADNAPQKCTFADDGESAGEGGEEDTNVLTAVANKAKAGKYFLKWKATKSIAVKKEDAKVYAAYTDNKSVNMQAFRVKNGYQHIKVNDVVLMISDKETINYSTTAFVDVTVGQGSSWLPIAGAANGNELKYLTASAKRSALEAAAPAGTYIYGWVNTTSGCGFQKITSGTNFPEKTLYIYANEDPAAGRLNVVWLDEDGNIEEEATAIQGIQNAKAENGAIYNLAGQKVNASYKGVVIKDGKKYMQK